MGSRGRCGSAWPPRPGFSSRFHMCREDRPMVTENQRKVAIVVFAHHKPRQLALLLSVLRHPRARVYLHVDRQSQLAPFRQAFSEAGVDAPVLLPRFAHRWGSAGIVDATVGGL